jgi:hypothetical protein
MMVKLESLANEILLGLFELLNGIHLLRAFHGLNSRFNNLLITYFQFNFLDFLHVSKTDFDDVCQQQLPLFADRIISLCLSNDDRTSQQTIRFLSHNLTLSQFTYLHVLTLGQLDSQLMNEMLDELSHLPHLIRLHIIDSSISLKRIDTIFCLPKLTHCSLDAINDQYYGCGPTIVSSSLQHLSIKFVEHRNDLKNLLKYLPCLRSFSVSYIHNRFIRLPLYDTEDSSIRMSSFMIRSLEIFKLDSMKSIDQLEGLIRHMPNLYQLTVDVMNEYVDGYKWQKMISNYLPKLKKFFMRMQFTLSDNTDIEQQVNQILNLFRTPFWIHEHRWFVRCHWDLIHSSTDYYIYTLPHISTKHMTRDIYKQYRSTCPNEDDYYSYDYVHKLSYDGEILSSKFLCNRFPNIHELSIVLPTDNNFLCVFPTLNQLKRVIVLFIDSSFTVQSQLQVLIDKAPRLYFLKTKGWIPTGVTSKSIRRLDFYDDDSFFNEQTCSTLCNSPLGIQCEFLSVITNNRNLILYLVNNMKNLRILQFRYQVDKQRYDLVQDGFVQWLQESLPSTCTISKDLEISNTLSICFTLWIR